MPTAVITAINPSVMTNAVCTVRCACSSLPAPKYCEITTPAPLEKPMNRLISVLMIGPTVPTAENASLLTKLPTTQVSTML